MLNFLDLALAAQMSLSPTPMGLPPVNGWVIGGTIVDPSESINKSIVKLGTCTGTLVSPMTVVTAAHCFDTKNPFAYGVRYAADLGDRSCAQTWVKAFSRPPGAEFNSQGFTYPDILLLKLGSPLCGAVPARLAQRVPVAGEDLQAAGYGKGSVSKVLPTRLTLRAISKTDGTFEALYADVTPEINPRIQQNIEDIRKHGLDHYEAAVGVNVGESLCNGDSGGPVYLNNDPNGVVELTGVNGAIVPHELKGAESCHRGFLQLYTPIAPFIPWILEKAAKWDANP